MLTPFFSVHLVKEHKFVRQKKVVKLYTIELEYPNGLFRSVQVRASTKEIAEQRALKRNPKAVGIKEKRDA